MKTTKIRCGFYILIVQFMVLFPIAQGNEFRSARRATSAGGDDLRKFQSDIVKEINNQRRAYSEDLRILQQQRQVLLNELKSHAEVIGDLSTELVALRNRIAKLESRNSGALGDFQSKLNELKALIKEESRRNQKTYQNALDDMASELVELDRSGEDVADQDIASGQLYKVVEGDTLGSIAKAFGVSLGNLKKANNLESDLILIDQLLKIPQQD